jgi:hypothetical protein
MFTPIGIAAQENGAPESPDAATTTINLPVYLLPSQETHPLNHTHPTPLSSTTSDKDVALFPVRPPYAPPTRTNNPPKA